eukprot:CAMPEP_0169478134 /NCGR_PEP_ID=MMETSP1042-20121227/28309_1 /TAXON_ID=464988 /ORGANISM="Hemiselmis andersenii, Strain CCMP1180" /LENGTH=44 /DNA_ID= /DNA_START= /DNA_END= /DNA_ORIENTATION=
MSSSSLILSQWAFAFFLSPLNFLAFSITSLYAFLSSRFLCARSA